MMLLQDKFANAVWIEWFIHYGVFTKEKIEGIMAQLNLKYRKDKSYNDLHLAICRGFERHKTDEQIDKIAEEIDKVLIRKRWDF